MQVCRTNLEGVFRLNPRVFRDERGSFVKNFEREVFVSNKMRTDFEEEFYSISGPRVLRGLHFQLPPYDHAKVVQCLTGSIFDVVLDLRVGSPTFGKHLCIELDAERADGLYISSGLAHGFYVLKAPATVAYKVTSKHVASTDAGIRWDSAGVPWPDSSPILSARDHRHPPLAEFSSPFCYQAEERE
jgi:dTDP-4-dehydrorhamnose 3,5-epimerase